MLTVSFFAITTAVLCRLACASLTEDRYGVVQRDIPRIVEALLSFLAALEEFQTELNARYALPPPDVLRGMAPHAAAEKETLAMEAARASEVTSVVGDGECVARSDGRVLMGDRGRQLSRTGWCRSCARSARSWARSGFRRGRRRSCRGSWITTEREAEAMLRDLCG